MRQDVSRGYALGRTERKLFESDPWAYGLGETSRKIIETTARYTSEQGLTPRPRSVDFYTSLNVVSA